MNKNRRHLLAALLAMPDQAFDLFVIACLPETPRGDGSVPIWPASLVGYTHDAEYAIREVQRAAAEYVAGAYGQMFSGEHQRPERPDRRDG
jgi:4'-phosphopantetheinyl transferase EntD